MNARKSRQLILVVATALAALAPYPSRAAAAAHDDTGCYRVALEHRPHWISAALADSSQVIVVDSWGTDGKRLLSYSPQGKVSVLPSPGGYSDPDFVPAKIARLGDGGFLLQLADGSTLQLDERLRLADRETALQERSGGWRVGSLYQFTTAGGAAVAYGSLFPNDHHFELGFFRVPLRSADGEQISMLERFDEPEFYVIGYPYFTAIDDDAYFVKMSKKPGIYNVSRTGHEISRLTAFPQECRVRPDFKTRMTGPKTAAAHFAELETFTVPAGLYSQGGMLYLLVRTPDPRRGTAWWLYEIEPRGDRIVGRVRLPTSASHVTLVPSESSWYLFERSSVGENQRQEIATMVVLPSSAVAALSLPASCPAR
jgi:hypothetical protein